jgi:acyl-CoA synthetase (AMP-forming)/AMP-acid ligase II
MTFEENALLLASGLVAGMLAMQEIGRRLGVRARTMAGDAAVAGTGVVEGAVFALLGLLIAFTFSGAASRFDERRKLIVEEANAIGTAYLRIDLLPVAAQADMRDSFRRYLDTRLAAYRAPTQVEFCDSLPETLIGKVLRRVLQENEELRRAAGVDRTASA